MPQHTFYRVVLNNIVYQPISNVFYLLAKMVSEHALNADLKSFVFISNRKRLQESTGENPRHLKNDYALILSKLKLRYRNVFSQEDLGTNSTRKTI